jgi:predicted deacylase
MKSRAIYRGSYVPNLIVAGIEVEPGNRVTRVVDVDLGNRSVEVPIIAVNGPYDGPHVAITGGIHGAEYVAIEAARRLGMTVDPGELHGSLAVVPISNTIAFYARSIYTSGLDDKNLNRVFPGDPAGSPSEVLANWLFQSIIRLARYYVDMHGGDMIEALVPFVLSPRCEDPAVEEASRAMAVATGIPRIIHGDVAGSTCGAAAAAGIPSILAEFGGQGVWSEALVHDHMTSTMRVLYHLGVLPGEVPPVAGQRLYETFAWMRAESSGLFHPVLNVGERVDQGQHVGSIVDYFGETLQTLKAVASGEVAFLVTALAVNSGDPLLAICA